LSSVEENEPLSNLRPSTLGQLTEVSPTPLAVLPSAFWPSATPGA